GGRAVRRDRARSGGDAGRRPDVPPGHARPGPGGGLVPPAPDGRRGHAGRFGAAQVAGGGRPRPVAVRGGAGAGGEEVTGGGGRVGRTGRADGPGPPTTPGRVYQFRIPI